MKTRYLETLIDLWIKWTGMVEINHKDFIDVVLIMSCQNSKSGLEDLWRRENPDSSEFTHYDRSPDTSSGKDRFFTYIKIANNTKINQIMVSFTDHYNAISFERLPPKTKIQKD